MTTPSLVLLLASVLYTLLGSFSTAVSPRSALNRSFGLLCACLALWGFCQAHFIEARDLSSAAAWLRVGELAQILAPAFHLAFIVILVSPESGAETALPGVAFRAARFRRALIVGALLAPPTVIALPVLAGRMLLSPPVMTPMGWREVSGSPNGWFLAEMVITHGYVLVGFVLTERWRRHAPTQMQSRQARAVLLIGLVSTALIALMGMLARTQGLSWMTGSPAVILGMLVWLPGTWLAARGTRLLRITPSEAAHEILGMMADGLLLVGPEGQVTFTNAAARKLLESHQGRLLDADIHHLLPTYRTARARPSDAGVASRPHEIELHGDQGQPLSLEVSSSPWYTDDGSLAGEIVVLHDVSARKRAEDDLRHAATHDLLTELPNRVLMRELVERALARARRQMSYVALLLVDLDNFKLINDTLGHEAGDRVLREVARRIAKTIRGSDAVARLGGDAFILALSDLSRREDAALAAERISKVVSAPLTVAEREVHLAASIGIAVAPEDGEHIEELLKRADLAMYAVKSAGKGSSGFFAPDMSVRAEQRVQVEEGLRLAIERDELEVYYQPMVDVVTGLVAEVEALLRWKRDGDAAVSPAVFIPVAEETGLIHKLGAWVLDRACEQNAKWRSEGVAQIPVAVNLSMLQFERDDLGAAILQTLHARGLEPSGLEVEVTESMLMRDPDRVLCALRDLRAAGVLVSVDDFGSGYSSLARLARLPVDTVKLDRLFIEAMTQDPDSRRLVGGIIDLAHGQRLRVVAEGIEHQEQLQLLRELAISAGQDVHDLAQGYLLARPAPAAACAAAMAALNRAALDRSRAA